MPKPKLSKVIKEEVKEPVFKVTLKMNNQVLETKTDDLTAFITSQTPAFLKTKVLLTVEKEGMRAEKMLIGFKAKQMFRNKLFLKVLLNKLSFKKYE